MVTKWHKSGPEMLKIIQRTKANPAVSGLALVGLDQMSERRVRKACRKGVLKKACQKRCGRKGVSRKACQERHVKKGVSKKDATERRVNTVFPQGSHRVGSRSLFEAQRQKKIQRDTSTKCR